MKSSNIIDEKVTLLDLKLLEDPNFLDQLWQEKELEILSETCPSWFLEKISNSFFNQKNRIYDNPSILALLSHSNLSKEIVEKIKKILGRKYKQSVNLHISQEKIFLIQ